MPDPSPIATVPPSPAGRLAGALRGLGWATIVAAALARAMCAVDPFPHWSLDPTRVIAPLTGLTPAWTLALDAATIIAAGLVLLADALARRGVSTALSALALAGMLGVAAHAWVLPGPRLENLIAGSCWAAAVAGGLALAHAARHAPLRRLTLALAAGLIAMLLGKGALQVLLEHPETMRQFRADPEGTLIAQGLRPGSAAALAFERRLSQPEATGWFGMANVYASLAAASLAMFLGWTIAARRRVSHPLDRPSEGWTAVLALGAIASGACVALAGSKGGFGAAALGVVLVVGGALAARRTRDAASTRTARLGGLVGVGCIAIMLAAVAARGIVGERLNELSILFRWFYMQAAARISLDALPWGTGPAGFKEAFILAKAPLCPEEVASPHSVLLDWSSTLGVPGLAWAALFVVLAWLGGRTLFGDARAPDPAADESSPAAPSSLATGAARAEARALALLAAIATIAATAVERHALLPETAVVRLLALVLWILLGLGVLALARTRVGTRGLLWPAAAGALVLVAHGQIELTFVWPSAAPLAMLVLGAAAAPALDLRRPRVTAFVALPALALVAAGMALLGFGEPRVAAWQHQLAQAAARVEPLANVQQRMAAIAAGQGTAADGDTASKLGADIADMVGEFPPTSREGFERALARLTVAAAGEADEPLARALALAPDHLSTREALVRLRMLRASALGKLGQTATVLQTVDEAARTAADAPPSLGRDMLLAQTHMNAYELTGDRAALPRALEAFERAAARDPHGPSVPWRAFLVARALDDRDAMRSWARRALDADALQRLDPIRQLQPEQRRDLEAALAEPPLTP